MVKRQEEKFRNYEECFLEMTKAFKALSFYPSGHPQRKTVTEKVHAVLRGSILKEEPMVLEFSKEGASWDNKLLGQKSDQGQALGREAFLRRVKNVKISQDVTPQEISAFLSAISLEPEYVHAQGGVTAFLRRQGVKNILLTEIHYELIREDLRRAKTKDEKDMDYPDDTIELLEEEVQEPTSGQNELTDEEKDTLKILIELEKETDHSVYLSILKKLVKACRKSVETGRSEVPFRCLQTLDAHGKDITRHDVQRRYAREAFSALADSKILVVLIGRLATRTAYNPEEYAAVFLSVGDKALSALIADLIVRKELKARRRVKEMVVRFGEKALPKIFPYLKDSRWYVVRNMVSLLGEIRSESSVGSLHEALHHRDPRVKKEAIKSLSSIRSRKALDYLIAALADEDTESATSCAFALGALKEVTAAPSLLTVAKKTRHKELQQEAILSLGKIGAKEAIPFLKNLLRKRRIFFSASIESLQASAALALGEIGGPEALTILKKGAESGRVSIRDACWKALRVMDEGLGGV